jgi:hypothetical protein
MAKYFLNGLLIGMSITTLIFVSIGLLLPDKPDICFEKPAITITE